MGKQAEAGAAWHHEIQQGRLNSRVAGQSVDYFSSSCRLDKLKVRIQIDKGVLEPLSDQRMVIGQKN